jgi:uncharacterized membrane protein YraQ (UPF0718 family)
MACFGELSGTHCLCSAQFINFGRTSSFRNRSDQIGEVFHVFISDLKDLVISVIAYCMATYVIAAVVRYYVQRSLLINTLQLGKILVLILMTLAHYNETTQRTTK